MNDIQIGDVFAHRTLKIKTPFTPVPFTATYEVVAIEPSFTAQYRVRYREGVILPDESLKPYTITLRALHHYKRENLHQSSDTRAWLITELPDPHGEELEITMDVLEKHFVFLHHVDGGIQ